MIFLTDLVEHDWFYAVTQHVCKPSGQHWFATSLKRKTTTTFFFQHVNKRCPLYSERTVYKHWSDSGVDTFGPIRQMSLTKWDCIISDRSWEWLSVLMKFMLLPEGWACLFPAGTWKNFFRKRRMKNWRGKNVVQQLCTIVVKGHYLKGKRICKSIININQTSTPSLNGAGQSNHWACQIKCFFFYIYINFWVKRAKDICGW